MLYGITMFRRGQPDLAIQWESDAANPPEAVKDWLSGLDAPDETGMVVGISSLETDAPETRLFRPQPRLPGGLEELR